MYKIELRIPGRRLVTSKTYQSEKVYNHWFMKHTMRYGRVYEVNGFKWTNEGWEPVKCN